ncbi:IS91 family transposase [Methylosinus sp. PW1]|uniref:IS91 family transposase n=1 Tax=Methylosinus sp. PW1 TaxID=107636 RepID=UPI00056432EC|nr:IS91 family transposase [Methylosinus sp. PW1]
MRQKIEVADIFRRYGAAFRAAQGVRLSIDQRRAMAAIEACRTAALGGHVEQCEDCGEVRVSYNSCRNRHCPKCQGLARAQWLADRRAELLPVPYFHVVFTVPAPIAAIALQNKALVYDILFKAASETIRVIAADPRHLGAETGMIAVLHTWGQTLTHHPHVHCIVPGGGLGPDGRWVACRPGFFLPVHVLSRLYRRLFLERVNAAFDAGNLTFFGDLAALRAPAAFARYLAPLRDIEWVVYAKRPFGGARQVLDYLGRYTHRVAIANGRLLACDDGVVRFRWKDYRANDKIKAMTLDADEFMRRFLIHVLPKGFRRIRHFGFLANARRAQKLAHIRAALDMAEPPPSVEPTDYRERYAMLTGKRIDICPCCGGRMVDFGPWPRPSPPRHSTQRCDTS